MVYSLIKSIQRATDYLEATGIKLVTEFKRRPRRDPLRRKKEQTERQIQRLFLHYLGQQKKRLLPQLENLVAQISPTIGEISKSLAIKQDDDWLIEELQKLFLDALNNGISAFGLTGLPINYDLVNDRAREWVQKYTFGLIKGIKDTTQKDFDHLVDKITEFITTGGYNLGDLERDLKPIFGAVRAEMIAITETTRAYAKANTLVGEELRSEFPDIPIVRIWYTSNDEIVCPICEPLDLVKVLLGEPFIIIEGEQINAPPAHVNCRCADDVTTDIEYQQEIA